MKSINAFAFSKCGMLEEIVLPASLDYIDSQAFGDCNRVKSIKVDDLNKRYDSRNNCNAIIETSSDKLLLGCDETMIPDGITAIGENAFALASNLNTITLPQSLLAIEKGAFYGCVALSTIIALMEDPFEITSNNVFPDVSNMALYVPIGTKELYLERGWNGFNEIVEISQ